jgi:hypothetical protein
MSNVSQYRYYSNANESQLAANAETFIMLIPSIKSKDASIIFHRLVQR